MPAQVDHDWMKKTFSKFGSVSYVSLPKYRSTGDLKGFGFVEFSTIDGAQRALEVSRRVLAP